MNVRHLLLSRLFPLLILHIENGLQLDRPSSLDLRSHQSRGVGRSRKASERRRAGRDARFEDDCQLHGGLVEHPCERSYEGQFGGGDGGDLGWAGIRTRSSRDVEGSWFMFTSTPGANFSSL